jgi:hypothetical protein
LLSVTVAGALFLFSASGTAQAVVPPGHAVGNQYVETVPGAGGEEATAPSHHATGGGGPGGDAGNGSSGSSGGPAGTPAATLGTKTAHRFEKAGSAGQATANLAAATDPSAQRHAELGRHQGGNGGESPLKQVVGHLTGTSGDSGMGVLLPLLILMTILVAAAFVFTRRRPAAPQE